MEKLDLYSFLKLDKEKLMGKVFCFPTDTVYGIGCLLKDEEAINKIYELKNRDKSKPLVNLISRLSQVRDMNIQISDFQKQIMFNNWPGALSVILENNNDSISFRLPNSAVVTKMCDMLGPIPTTSVNESGEKELNSFEEIQEAFGEKIDYFINDKEKSMSKLASTVVDLRGDVVKVLRAGSVVIK